MPFRHNWDTEQEVEKCRRTKWNGWKGKFSHDNRVLLFSQDASNNSFKTRDVITHCGYWEEGIIVVSETLPTATSNNRLADDPARNTFFHSKSADDESFVIAN